MKQHKMSGTRTYHSWEAMKQRCNNPRDKDYRHYGGKGVKVCEQWADFRNFIADMGECPEGKTLDRISSTGNYEPENCRWADSFQQKHNRTDNVQLTFEGRTQPMACWARELNLHFETVRHRLLRGWSVEKALSTRPVKRANGSTYQESNR